jgi:hypothetical protein
MFGEWLMRRLAENPSRDKFDITHIEDAALNMRLVDFDIRVDRFTPAYIEEEL